MKREYRRVKVRATLELFVHCTDDDMQDCIDLRIDENEFDVIDYDYPDDWDEVMDDRADNDRDDGFLDQMERNVKDAEY